MKRYFPTSKDIIYSTIAAISNHTHIINPIVYNPLPNSEGEFLPIKIQRYRTYDGKELIEPGLTLAVYPTSTNKTESSAYREITPSATFTPYEMGPKNSDYLYESTYRFTVALYYQEVAINESKQLVYFPLKQNKAVIIEDMEIAKERQAQFWKSNVVSVEINPGEDILRDYIEVIRLILEEITVEGFMPWRVRGSSVVSYDFPTSSWTAQSENVFFHFAYLNWELSMFAPAVMKDISLSQEQLVKELRLSTLI
jgi:hypothetical protein